VVEQSGDHGSVYSSHWLYEDYGSARASFEFYS